MFLKGIFVNIGEVDIVELHAAQLFQLLLHPAAHLQRKFQDLFQLFFRELTVRIDQLYQAADHFSNSYGVALIQVGAQAKIFVQSISVLLFAQFTDEFGQIIGDKSVVICKMLRPEFRDLPSRDVAVDPVKEGRVCSHFRREWIKKTGCFE